MLTAILDLRIAEGKQVQAQAILLEILKQTRAFPGCSGIETFTAVDDEHRIVVLEHWESESADAAYRAWRSTEEGSTALGTVLAAVPSLIKLRRVQA